MITNVSDKEEENVDSRLKTRNDRKRGVTPERLLLPLFVTPHPAGSTVLKTQKKKNLDSR